MKSFDGMYRMFRIGYTIYKETILVKSLSLRDKKIQIQKMKLLTSLLVAGSTSAQTVLNQPPLSEPTTVEIKR